MSKNWINYEDYLNKDKYLNSNDWKPGDVEQQFYDEEEIQGVDDEEV